MICLRSYKKTAGKKCRLEVTVSVHSTCVQSMKILCCFFSRQFLFQYIFVQYSSSVIGAVISTMQ